MITETTAVTLCQNQGDMLNYLAPLGLAGTLYLAFAGRRPRRGS